jgi:hypothetical protein
MNDRNMKDRERVTPAALIFVFCCMLSVGRVVWDAPRPKAFTNEVARRSDQRFAALKAELPGRGVIGYVGEPRAAALGDYYLAQYALAPLVVEHSPNHAIVVGNFPPLLKEHVVTGVAPLPLLENLQLVKDFGGGVFLFSNKSVANKSSDKGAN